MLASLNIDPCKDLLISNCYYDITKSEVVKQVIIYSGKSIKLTVDQGRVRLTIIIIVI